MDFNIHFGGVIMDKVQSAQYILKSMRNQGVDASKIKKTITSLSDKVQSNQTFSSKAIGQINQFNLEGFANALNHNVHLGRDLGKQLLEANLINEQEQQQLAKFDNYFNGLNGRLQNSVKNAFIIGDKII